MKAPQDCTGVNIKLEAKKSKKKKKGKDGAGEDAEDTGSVFGNGSLRRTSTSSSVTPSVTTTNSAGNAPSPIRTSTVSSMRPAGHTRHISGAPPPEKFVTSPTSRTSPISPFSSSNGGGGTANSQKAKVLYGYDATSPEELSVKQSDTITVLEPDDGSGWILARIGREEGLVPASYVELQSSETPKKGPPVAPRRGGKKAEEPKRKYLRALYDYDAGSELELSIREGDLLVVVAEDKGDGWTEVEMKGRVGSVPSNYVEVTEKA